MLASIQQLFFIMKSGCFLAARYRFQILLQYCPAYLNNRTMSSSNRVK